MVGIIGYNLSKIDVERNPAVKGKISIKNNVQIKDVDKADLFLGNGKQEGLKFKFEYISSYEPGAGKIVLSGELIGVDDSAKVKEIIDGWKKGRKLTGDIMAPVLNSILTRCNILAIILSREVALPPPVQLPKVQVKK